MCTALSVKRPERKRCTGSIDSNKSKMQHAALSSGHRVLAGAAADKSVLMKNTALSNNYDRSPRSCLGEEKRLNLLLKCFTFCWGTVTLEATCLLRKLWGKAKPVNYNVRRDNRPSELQGHANTRQKNQRSHWHVGAFKIITYISNVEQRGVRINLHATFIHFLFVVTQ